MEQKHNPRLHLDFRDPRIQEEYNQLWKNIPVDRTTNPHFFFLRYATFALSFDPNNETLRDLQRTLLAKLGEASLSPFRADPEATINWEEF